MTTVIENPRAEAPRSSRHPYPSHESLMTEAAERREARSAQAQPASGIYVAWRYSSRRRYTRYWRGWSSDVCSSDLQRSMLFPPAIFRGTAPPRWGEQNGPLVDAALFSSNHRGLAQQGRSRSLSATQPCT